MSSHSPGLRNIARHSSRYEDYAAVGRGEKEGGKDSDDATCTQVRCLYNGIPVTPERVNK